MSKLTPNKARRLRILLDWGVPMASIARKWGVNRHTIKSWSIKLENEPEHLVDKD